MSCQDDEWFFRDLFGRSWHFWLPRADERGELGDSDLALEHPILELVHFSFDEWGATDSDTAFTLVSIWDALAHDDLGDRLRHPTVDRDRAFHGFKRRLQDTLRDALTFGALRFEAVHQPLPTLEDEPAPDTVPEPVVPEQTTFVAVRLLDQDGNPVPQAAFRLTLPDQSEQSGALNAEGGVRLDGVSPPGACTVVFPDFDVTDFSKPVAMAGSRGPGTNEPVKAEGGGQVHVATATDTLVSITEQYGFANFETVWNAPGNSGLRSKRKNPQTLIEGDEVVIPDKRPGTHSAHTGAESTITVFLQRTRVRVKLLAFDGTALSGAHAKVAALGAPDELDSDGDGVLDVSVAANAQDLTLDVQGTVWPLAVGALAPIDSPSGIRHRLASLGYDAGDDDDDTDEALRWAIEEFEQDHGHKPAGKVDDGFLDNLSDAHGA